MATRTLAMWMAAGLVLGCSPPTPQVVQPPPMGVAKAQLHLADSPEFRDALKRAVTDAAQDLESPFDESDVKWTQSGDTLLLRVRGSTTRVAMARCRALMRELATPRPVADSTSADSASVDLRTAKAELASVLRSMELVATQPASPVETKLALLQADVQLSVLRKAKSVADVKDLGPDLDMLSVLLRLDGRERDALRELRGSRGEAHPDVVRHLRRQLAIEHAFALQRQVETEWLEGLIARLKKAGDKSAQQVRLVWTAEWLEQREHAIDKGVPSAAPLELRVLALQFLDGTLDIEEGSARWGSRHPAMIELGARQMQLQTEFASRSKLWTAQAMALSRHALPAPPDVDLRPARVDELRKRIAELIVLMDAYQPPAQRQIPTCVAER